MGYLATLGVVLAAACVLAAYYPRLPAAPLRFRSNAPIESSLVRPFRGISPAHHDGAMRALDAFGTDCRLTFLPAAARDPATHVRKLFAHRAKALGLLNELRLRLPNDLHAEKQLTSAIEGLDASMLERIQDARQRCGAPLVHPGPADAAWYGAWYRAANDVVT